MKKAFYLCCLFLLFSCAERKKEDAIASYFFPLIPQTPFRDMIRDTVEKWHQNSYHDSTAAAVYLDMLMTLLDNYQSELSGVFIAKTPFEVTLVTRSGERFWFAGGRVVPEGTDYRTERLGRIIYPYPDTLTLRTFRYRQGHSSLAFYESIYGKTNQEVVANLESTTIFGRHRYFNAKNNARYELEQAVKEIEGLETSDDAVAHWIKSIRSVFTYSNRTIATSNVPSMHSFGIAVDFRFYKEKSNIYWYWSSFFADEWWKIPLEERVTIPEQIVRIFEKHGFVWGGKWINFDIMHFEYRPEITKRAFRYSLPDKKVD